MIFGHFFKFLLYIFVIDVPLAFGAPEIVQNDCPSDRLIYPCKCLRDSNKGLYVRCENTNLASLSIAIVNIANLKLPIENLTIYQGNIERLFGNIFYNSTIRILQIEETPLKIIDEYVYYGVNNTLQELHIIKSQLQEFPGLAFKVLGNLSVLNIDKHQIQKLDNTSFFESTIQRRLDHLFITNGYIDDIAAETFLPLHKLKYLDLHGNKLRGLKRGQFKNLHNVEVLDLSYNNISKIDVQHLSDLTKLGWCNVSHNSLTELTRGTFSRNSVVKVINLAFNNITRLDANSFRGLRLLRRLYMNDNSISDVARGTFGSVLRIGTIDLARNKLKKIDYQMFAQLNYVEIIDVAENNITKIEKQAFKDIYLARINISHNRIDTIEKYAFENCANLTVLDLSHNLLTNISKDAFDSITFATELQYSYNFFTDISMIAIQNMTGLRILNVSHNQIDKIPKNTFPPLYELHTIDASYNNLSSIANAVFQPLFSLRYLFLQYNLMENIGTPVFNTIPTLLHLDLSYNKLKTVAQKAFTKLTSLRFLNLKNNMIESFFEIPLSLNHLDLRINWLQEIPSEIWPVMNSLISLDLSGNRLGDSLRSRSFAGLLTLQTLKINDNGISQVPYEALFDLPTLQYLHFENNNVTSLTKHAFGKLPVLFELNLYNNNINNISMRAFDGLLQLLKLNLSSNAIRYLPNGVFLGLVSLQTLDLSYNLLEKLDNKTNGVLEDCLSLESVNLSHNKVNFINRKTFPSNPYIPYKLYDVDLSHNKMYTVTYDITFGMKNVRKLNLSSNLISEIRKGVLETFKQLSVLDLSGNALTDLCPENDIVIFKLPLSLNEIYLQDNKIARLPFEEFSMLKNLTKIDLRANEFEQFPIELTEQIKNGVEVLLKDNPLLCDCHIRPLKHYLDSLPLIPKELTHLECVTPSEVPNSFISEISDDQLYCNDTKDSQVLGNEYDILPDIRFRDITFSSGWLTVEWYVTSNRDVADFYISLSNEKNVIYFDKHVGYINRSVKVPGSIISKALAESENIKLCALAKDSNGVIRRWFKSQCIQIPAEFQNTIQKYSKSYSGVFVLVTKSSQQGNVLKSGCQEVTSCFMQQFSILLFLLSVQLFL